MTDLSESAVLAEHELLTLTDVWTQRQDNEHAMERMLRSYIDDFGPRRKFAFGQLPNLLHTIAKICEEHSQLEDDDWEKAAVLLEEVSDKCDLKYAEDE